MNYYDLSDKYAICFGRWVREQKVSYHAKAKDHYFLIGTMSELREARKLAYSQGLVMSPDSYTLTPFGKALRILLA